MVRVDLSKQRYGLFLNVANFRGRKAKGTALLSEKTSSYTPANQPLKPLRKYNKDVSRHNKAIS